MTDTRKPDPCHYNRRLEQRVTRRHRDDCTTNTCDGCAPCTAPHCIVCGRRHVTNSEPITCARCVGRVVEDLADIRAGYALLATEAVEAGADGRLVAAAPIPGGTAAVLIGPTVRLDLIRTGRGLGAAELRRDHGIDAKGHSHDPIPPLAVLAQWEEIYRAWLDHTPGRGRATIGRAIGYLIDQIPYLANHTDPGQPDWLAFTRQIRSLRASVERALHNEREPERGVECFECGDQLVRKFGRATRCRHDTPPKVEVRRWLHLRYPEAIAPSMWRDARRPCGDCDQGGISNPSAGQSWECPGCRKVYDPGEYATAVRRDLLQGGADGDGWTHISMAAEAAATLTGHVVLAGTVRKWVERGRVGSRLDGRGVRLVFWPDVADAAVAAVQRAREVEEARARRAREYAAWSELVAAGVSGKEAGERLGIQPERVRRFIDEWERIGA